MGNTNLFLVYTRKSWINIQNILDKNPGLMFSTLAQNRLFNLTINDPLKVMPKNGKIDLEMFLNTKSPPSTHPHTQNPTPSPRREGVASYDKHTRTHSPPFFESPTLQLWVKTLNMWVKNA